MSSNDGGLKHIFLSSLFVASKCLCISIGLKGHLLIRYPKKSLYFFGKADVQLMTSSNLASSLMTTSGFRY